MINSLNAISPVDGRYRSKVEQLAPYYSEWGLFKYRVWVEIEYFIAFSKAGLDQFRSLSESEISSLRDLYLNFAEEDAASIKEIEKTTNHDVKAVEYFIKEKLKGSSVEELSEFVHFGLTSQDINNTAIPLSLHQGINEVLIPRFEKIQELISNCAKEWKTISLLSRTHGQPASPTTMGKEFRVFAERIRIQLEQLKTIPISAKFGGATGSFNAHKLAFPDIDWRIFGKDFVESLGLQYSYPTTQIDHYDQLAALFDCLRRIDTILIDFARDVWQYISMDFFKQKIKKGEIGSSAMPHKVNPIDFENAEGNLGVASAIFDHLSNKLPISRLQRDLTDSTVLRNIGVPFAHQMIALASLEKGIGKLLINETRIARDLDDHYVVIAEAIQTILRREKVQGAYELLLELTRTNEKIDAESFSNFVDQLDVTEDIKEELRKITPSNYIGYAAE